MELAGLSCAQALQDAYPDTVRYSKILVCCGPGNQARFDLVQLISGMANFLRSRVEMDWLQQDIYGISATNLPYSIPSKDRTNFTRS